MKQEKAITLIALVITIIILLILAGISIATLTGENGLLTKANTAKQQTEEKSAKEKIEIAIAGSIDEDGSFNVEDFEKEIKNLGGTITEKTEETITVEMDGYEAVIDIKTGKIIKFESTKGVKPKVEVDLYKENGSVLLPGTSYEKVVITVNVLNKADIDKIDEIIVKDKDGNIIEKEENVIGSGEASFKVAGTGTYTVTVKATTEGFQKETTIEVPIKVAPEGWKITTTTDNEWYDYGNSKISGPKLAGEMTPIKYIGEQQDGNKWANCITTDGSMWVWIPRYAYKITSGYHTTTAGTIEVAFLDVNNNFLNGETGQLLTDPSKVTYTNNVQEQWLVHPAFTSNAEYGGGFGELEGLWVGKFEATGTSTNLSVKPGERPLVNMTINQQYQLAKKSKFGEDATINAHMAKNSEWGAIVYIGHSKYGINGQKVAHSSSTLYTGGSETKNEIYTLRKKQSTTYNATGVYDMNGGVFEFVASYVNNGFSALKTYGGTNSGDLYGANTKETAESTAYKTVYEGSGTQSADYEISKKYKGDAGWEISCSKYPSSSQDGWHQGYFIYPGKIGGIYSDIQPFFKRSNHKVWASASLFSLSGDNGSGTATPNTGAEPGTRTVLAF